MDMLEEAILIAFNESTGIDAGLKSRAVAYCQQIKENPTICRICIEKLCCCKLLQVQFWCLQTLHEVIRVKYSLMGLEEKEFFRKSLLSIACFEDKNGSVLETPAFIKNKLAQVFVSLIYFDYPMNWSSVFVDFLPNLSKGVSVIDMFCRVLNALDDELISLDYPRTPDEVSVAARVKDAMRQQCVGQIVRAWYEIISLYRNSDHELCSAVLDTMRRYISWIDIGLIANDVFIPLLFELVLLDQLSDQLRCAAAGCVLAVISKRMEPSSKLSLLESLQIGRVFGLIAHDSDSVLVSGIASLLIRYATEVLECSKRLTSEDTKQATAKLFDEVLPLVFYAAQNCELDSSLNMVQLFSTYMAIMKAHLPLKEKELHQVGQILEVIRTQVRYDPSYLDNLDIKDKIGSEEEDRMSEFRKDLFVLLRSVGRAAPHATLLFIRNSLSSVVGSSSEEVEASLSLFHALGEAQNDESIKAGSALLNELVPVLLSTKFPCHSNRLVALVYLDTITRYLNFIQYNAQYIPLVLGAFLDERGIHHSNPTVSRRASYLFMRVVRLLKSKLVPFIERILQSLQDAVARFTSVNYTSKKHSGSEDGSHIFEAIGILIGMSAVPLEKQVDYLSSLMTPLCQQVKSLLLNPEAFNTEESSAKIEVIQQIIIAINALSKGFNECFVTASRPAVGHIFKETLDVLLQILVVYPKVETLRNRVLSFIHRMVDTLGASVFPFLPKALEQLLVESEPEEMIRFIVLLNQLICKFNTSVKAIIDEVFPVITGRIFSIIPTDAIISGPSSNTEEFRELQELQKSLYTFLHVITMHGLSSIFLSIKSRGFLENLIQLILYTSCNHQDITIRKACVQIFTKLIKDWCAGSQEEKVPGFKKFAIEAFATNCCLYSVLDKSFEFRDANTLVLFGEIVLAQKVMYEKFGDDFLVDFVPKAFPAAHCPQELVQQYCQNLQGTDIKALKSLYRSLIENLRNHQNGSLVFR